MAYDQQTADLLAKVSELEKEIERLKEQLDEATATIFVQDEIHKKELIMSGMNVNAKVQADLMDRQEEQIKKLEKLLKQVIDYPVGRELYNEIKAALTK